MHTLEKQSLKWYHKFRGNFRTSAITPVRRAMELGKIYFPGIQGVLRRIQEQPESQKKYCRHHQTVGVISTRSSQYYPLLTARAALLSEVTGLNVIPIMIRYDSLQELPGVLRQISPSFQSIFCTDLTVGEKAMLTAGNDIPVPLLFQDEMMAAACEATVQNACRMLGKKLQKLALTIEGSGNVLPTLLESMKKLNMSGLTLIDAKGPLYLRRPNMNRDKIDLLKIMKLEKDERTREEVLAATDIYLYSSHAPLDQTTLQVLNPKAVIITLMTTEIPRNITHTVVSTLPGDSNYITDLHLTAGVVHALSEGKAFTEKTLEQAKKGFMSYYRSPKPRKIVPGLMEKNLAAKISESIK